MASLSNYIYSLIWGFLKEIPILFITFYLFDKVTKKCEDGYEKGYSFFYKGLLISGIFIGSLTINSIYSSGVLITDFVSLFSYGVNVDLFSSIVSNMKKAIDFDLKACIELVGNIFLFMPFGFFCSYFLWNRKRRILKTAKIGLIISFLIEITQLVCGRVFDIDDIVLNVIGTLVGYYAFSYLKQTTLIVQVLNIKIGDTFILKNIKWKYYIIIAIFIMYIRMIV